MRALVLRVFVLFRGVYFLFLQGQNCESDPLKQSIRPFLCRFHMYAIVYISTKLEQGGRRAGVCHIKEPQSRVGTHHAKPPAEVS